MDAKTEAKLDALLDAYLEGAISYEAYLDACDEALIGAAFDVRASTEAEAVDAALVAGCAPEALEAIGALAEAEAAEDTHLNILRRELAGNDDEHCTECGALLTSENDGGGIEILGQGWICLDCHNAFLAADEAAEAQDAA